ncbi:YceG family protein [Bacillus sp. T33-2]|uniref:YceG family protein n=1 Tax=Bacillus sp. T33-2 TaxID=2054168 RepID=UPI000C7706CD|nr:YceG family protein [Bacillus sp. T33-2]PLR98902.1 hypothetical protein CVD19_04545 [Bacillus sp. T33-2]
MYLSHNQLELHILPLSYENWFAMLEKPNSERPFFQAEGAQLHTGQVLARFCGIPLDEDEYYNHLFDLVHAEENGLSLISQDSLDKSIANQQFQSIQRLLDFNREQSLSINRFAAFLDGERLLVDSQHPLLHRKIREAITDTILLFVSKEADGMKSPEFRRVLVDLIKWSFNHLQEPIRNADPSIAMPKWLWYGDFNKSQQYFVYFLMKLGCDIVAFHPDGDDIFALVDPEKSMTFVHNYPEQKEPEPFPVEKRKRKATIAYRASREIETILNHEGSGLYKPWQLRDYTPTAVTLKTTYDELFIIAKEKAMFRPDFTVKNGEVKIPSLFSKIQGVSRNRKEYWDRLHSTVDLDNSLLINQFPFTAGVNSDFRFHYQNAIGLDGLPDPGKMMRAHYWRYTHLPAGLQKGIAHAIRSTCAHPGLKTVHNETWEQVKIYLFTHGMQIPEKFLQMLQKFDYSQDVPKFIFYNNELNGTMRRSDAALLLLLNQFGADILLYNPQGRNDIENFIEESFFDVHWLDDIVFDQEYKEPSVLKHALFRRFLKNIRGD